MEGERSDGTRADGAIHYGTDPLLAASLIFVGPKLTRYSRKQWAIMMVTLFTLWIPMGYYVIVVLGSTKTVDSKHVARIAVLNLGIVVTVLILVGRKVLLRK